MKARAKSQQALCVENLKQVGLAVRLWSTDSGDKYPMSVSTNWGGTLEYVATGESFRHFQALSNGLPSPRVLVCPSDRFRTSAKNFAFGFSSNNVSYFIGVDADESWPNMLLSGDRNITNDLPVQNRLMILTPNNPATWRAGIHGAGRGTLGMSDGSVQQVNTLALQQQIAKAVERTNRLAMP